MTSTQIGEETGKNLEQSIIVEFVRNVSSRGWIRYVEMNENGCALIELPASGRMRLEEHLLSRANTDWPVN